MSIEKKPFVNYRLDEDKEDGVETISMKVNKEERELIERLKRYTNYGQDAKVIKASMQVFEKVILNTFGDTLFMKFTSSDRRKPIFETDKKESTFDKK